MDYERLRKLFIEFLKERINTLEDTTRSFTKEFLERLKAQGYELTPELEKSLEEFAKVQSEFIKELVQTSVAMVGRSHNLRDEQIAKIAQEAFEKRWEDGKNLPQRLRSWSGELVQRTKTLLSQGIYRGRSVSEVAYEIEQVVKNTPHELEERLPKWLSRIEDTLRPLLTDTEGRRLLKGMLSEIEKEIRSHSRRTPSRLRNEELIRKIRQAIEQGSEEILDRALEQWLRDKQQFRLRMIAQSESAYAYGRATIEANPEAKAFRWKLSSSHPEPDICDVYATMDYGLGKGVHPREKLPRFPAHPLCLCYLRPVYTDKEPKRLKLDEETMRRIAPRYVQDLEALGVNIKRLWNEKELRFYKRKELVQRVGEEELGVLEAIGRTVREGRWKPAQNKDIRREKKALERKYSRIPQEVANILKKATISSLELHYIKRKYLDSWDLKSPAELDKMFTKHIKNPEVLIYRQGDRLALELGRYVAIIHPPNTRITLFELDEQYENYEDYATQSGRTIIKLWRLKHILRRLL